MPYFRFQKHIRLYIIFVYLLVICLSFSCNKNNKEIVTVPFRIIKNQIFIQLNVNKTLPAEFIFDTGQNQPSIDSTFIKKIKYKTTGTVKVNCAGGINEYPLIKCNYSINNVNFDSLTTYVCSFNHYKKIFNTKVHGIIGYNLFENYILNFDMLNKQIKIEDKINFEVPDGYTPVYLALDSLTPYIMASLTLRDKSVIKGRFVIDTGSNASLTLFSNQNDTAKLYSFIGKYLHSVRRDICGNTINAYNGFINSVQIGSLNIKFSATSYVFPESESGIFSRKKYTGLIGLKFLKNFHFILDINHNRLYLKHINS